MPRTSMRKYVWLAETIYRAGSITLAELNRKWVADRMGQGPIPERSFHKWRTDVEDLFGLAIECDLKNGYRYYITNRKAVNNGGVRSWLLNSLATTELFMQADDIRDRIVLEDVPSGNLFLSIIVDSMKQGRVLSMTYQSYKRTEGTTYDVLPYCVRLWRQRWYMVAWSTHYEQVRTYGLDRIRMLEKTDAHFVMPADWSAADYFEGCFGVIADKTVPIVEVRLRVMADQANYLRDLPLHTSQQEVERGEEWSIFTLWVRPTIDFRHELLSYGRKVEVLEPLSLREALKAE